MKSDMLGKAKSTVIKVDCGRGFVTPAITLLLQPIGVPEQNYAKAVSRHPTASCFAEKYG
jgi:hypothetical protein